tara:strand:+ start:8076 stop:8492 length:417 start_codon:yes stop_codon:yes gene_type:complete
MFILRLLSTCSIIVFSVSSSLIILVHFFVGFSSSSTKLNILFVTLLSLVSSQKGSGCSCSIEDSIRLTLLLSGYSISLRLFTVLTKTSSIFWLVARLKFKKFFLNSSTEENKGGTSISGAPSFSSTGTLRYRLKFCRF